MHLNIKARLKNEIWAKNNILKTSSMDAMSNKKYFGKAINRALGKISHDKSQEQYILYLLNNEDSNKRIKLNLQFWFYFVLVSAFLVNVLLFFVIVMQ